MTAAPTRTDFEAAFDAYAALSSVSSGSPSQFDDCMAAYVAAEQHLLSFAAHFPEAA